MLTDSDIVKQKQNMKQTLKHFRKTPLIPTSHLSFIPDSSSSPLLSPQVALSPSGEAMNNAGEDCGPLLLLPSYPSSALVWVLRGLQYFGSICSTMEHMLL